MPCNALKGDLNHWFVVLVGDLRDGKRHQGSLGEILKFEQRFLRLPNAVPVCGHQCLHRLISKITE